MKQYTIMYQKSKAIMTKTEAALLPEISNL